MLSYASLNCHDSRTCNTMVVTSVLQVLLLCCHVINLLPANHYQAMQIWLYVGTLVQSSPDSSLQAQRRIAPLSWTPLLHCSSKLACSFLGGSSVLRTQRVTQSCVLLEGPETAGKMVIHDQDMYSLCISCSPFAAVKGGVRCINGSRIYNLRN